MASLLYILFFRKELRNKALNSKLGRVSLARGNRVDPSQVVQLSWVLTDDECDHLILLSQDIKEASSGEGQESSKSLLRIDASGHMAPSSFSRFSQGNSIYSDDDKLARIEDRISAWTLLPRGNTIFEWLVLWVYQATLVLYLSNVTAGGGILFPDSERKNNIWSECSKTNKSSSHLGCPVLEGKMWSATKFFYLRPIDGGKASVLVPSESDGSECADEDDNCARWAAIGECQRNPIFMIGSPDYYGTCRKSCDAC
ncbi:hypothetical protein K2173_003881 [Erythroxylum novogranatense]|uniref:procollagen-proline 4-dioxygenase n=1 Tax=Erythroxylum novogranatense TaxID=1862640 RepID=A0AAV8SJ42_9ROSI|nr:hypothetical protein K2173_003881 [Erythroxylum novogranatense]